MTALQLTGYLWEACAVAIIGWAIVAAWSEHRGDDADEVSE